MSQIFININIQQAIGHYDTQISEDTYIEAREIPSKSGPTLLKLHSSEDQNDTNTAFISGLQRRAEHAGIFMSFLRNKEKP